MTTKHTPGPWRAEVPPSSAFLDREIRGPNDELIASIGHNVQDDRDGDIHTRVANARLIAAAPELLEALKGLEAEMQRMKHIAPHVFQTVDARPVDAARAAIAKATQP